jgi:NDP-sugar pyrophosphorylase family protein
MKNNNQIPKWLFITIKQSNFFSDTQLSKLCTKKPRNIIHNITQNLLTNIKKTTISPDAQIASNVVIQGKVFIGSGVRIMENVKITGPSYIGNNTIIGNSSLIRHSYISDNSVVGYLVDIARSFISPDCWFSRVHIADSIIGKNVNLGGGTVLASLRLDNKRISHSNKVGAIIGNNTQIGTNVTILPGICIGQNCMIGAGVVVNKDILDGIYCKLQQEVIFKANNQKYDPNKRKQFKTLLLKEYTRRKSAM